MLTVKLTRKRISEGQTLWSTKIIEAEIVDIHEISPNKLSEIAIDCNGKFYSYYIANNTKPRLTPSEGLPEGIEVWHCAYIENPSGSTTETVSF